MSSLQLKAIFNTRKEIKTLLLLIHALARVTKAALNQNTVQILFCARSNDHQSLCRELLSSHEVGSLLIDQTRVTN